MSKTRKTVALVSIALALARPEPAPAAADPEPLPVENLPVYERRGPRRGLSTQIHRLVGPPLVLALAPNHGLGLTINEQPNLYFYLEMDISLEKDGPFRVDFTLIDEQAVKLLLEITVPGPLLRGVHTVRLSDHGLSLEPGRRYQWSVAVVAREGDVSKHRISRGFITRTDVPEDLTRRLETRGLDEAANVFAESGLWYDAIMALTVAIETHGEQTPLRRARAALLDQVGLARVAEYDRAGRP